MQLIENKRPNPFLIAEISAIRRLTLHFRTPQNSGLSGAPSGVHSGSFAGAAPAKGGIFQPNRHTYRKLEKCITVLQSITSKFLIDNFYRDFSSVSSPSLIRGAFE